MSQVRTIEVFTAGCPVCEEAVAQIKAEACPSCKVVVYDLNEGCDTMECREIAKRYGIKSVPAVVIDGLLAACCEKQGVNIQTLKEMGVGQAS